RLAVAGQVLVNSRRIVPVHFRPFQKTDVLSSSRRDQAVDRVIYIVIARGNDLIIEIQRLLRVISDGSDVADGIVRVMQVLQGRLMFAARGFQMNQAES